jgi:hypothetical protein
MALADRKQLAEKKPAFERWLDSLSEGNRAVVIGWLRDPEISNQRIADWIREDDEEDEFEGYRAGKDTISIWRRAHGVVRTA